MPPDPQYASAANFNEGYSVRGGAQFALHIFTLSHYMFGHLVVDVPGGCDGKQTTLKKNEQQTNT